MLDASEVEFLGYRVLAEGIRPLPDNVSAIVDFSVSMNTEELARYIEMHDIYHRFMPLIAHQFPVRPRIVGHLREHQEI